MKTRLVILLCLILGLSAASGQESPKINLGDTILLKYAQSFVHVDVTTVEVKSKNEAKFSRRRVVTILSDKSKDQELYVGYDSKSKFGSFKARIYDANGELIKKFGKDDAKDYSASSGIGEYDDSRFKYVDFSYNRFPYTIEYEYDKTIKGMRFAAFPDWHIQGFRQAVKRSTFTVIAPKDFRFHYESLNGEFEPLILNEAGKNTYIWEVTNLPAKVAEAYGSGGFGNLPRLSISPDQFELDGYSGSLESWQAYGAFIHKLYQDRSQLPPEAAEEVRSLVDGIDDPKEKIRILYRYLQENMRYVSVQYGVVGGWQPLPPEVVYSKKYGDCKALSNYMHTMLREVGIASHPVIIYSGDKLPYEVNDTFASPEFNHVVLYVPEQDIWLECTSNSFPTNYLGSSNSDRKVLVISPKEGFLVQTPKMDPEDNLEIHKVKITLDESGNADFQINNRRHGKYHEYLRGLVNHTDLSEQRDWLMENSPLPSFSLNSFDIQVEKDEPVASLTYEATVNQYARKMGKRMFVPLNTLSAMSRVPDKDDNREQPIIRKMGYVERDTFSIQIPEGYRVESLNSQAFSFENEFGSYSLEFLPVENGVIRFVRNLEILPVHLPADRFTDFRSFYLAISKADNRKVVLVQQKT